MSLGIIGGTGLTELNGLAVEKEKTLKTPFGAPSAPFVIGKFRGEKVIFLARHGRPHKIPPHMINYRANMWGMKKLGATRILSVMAVGGITKKMKPMRIVIPDQIIDYTYARKHTFFAKNLKEVTHIDFSHPYTPALRNDLIREAKKKKIKVVKTGTYGCTQGPRLESGAEILRMQSDGCDVVGMTGMPEAALAHELNLDYAGMAIVANWAAGKTDSEITMEDIHYYLAEGMKSAMLILSGFIRSE
ncbi:MAG: S-methyl-5'-thioinosine phosphorylase [Methylococcales bacterium]|nr:S-methyl-5'-thioinosine phosphorylase [Methylococcales bacterium]MCK5925221.1 S-methyl-5'-thioinosine phosphorylase [Methylococcales bacterium]